MVTMNYKISELSKFDNEVINDLVYNFSFKQNNKSTIKDSLEYLDSLINRESSKIENNIKTQKLTESDVRQKMRFCEQAENLKLRIINLSCIYE